MSGVWNVPAAERVAALRNESARYGGDSAQEQSDLEVLNAAYESVLRSQIDTRDAYMRLLTDLRHHSDKVNAGAFAGVRTQIDRHARAAVREHLKPSDNLLYQLAHLHGPVSREDAALLRHSAEAVRHDLREAGAAEDRLDPGDARQHLTKLRSVVTILQGRDGVTAQDALRLMDAALNEGPLLDLFKVGTPPRRQQTPPPAFDGPHWTVHAHVWTYQPTPQDGFVTAIRLDDDDEWRVDLWSPAGPLLARGTAPEADIAALAPILVAQCTAWTQNRDYAWRRFAETAATLQPSHPREAQVQAANLRTGRPSSPAPPKSTGTAPVQSTSATAARRR